MPTVQAALATEVAYSGHTEVACSEHAEVANSGHAQVADSAHDSGHAEVADSGHDSGHAYGTPLVPGTTRCLPLHLSPSHSRQNLVCCLLKHTVSILQAKFQGLLACAVQCSVAWDFVFPPSCMIGDYKTLSNTPRPLLTDPW